MALTTEEAAINTAVDALVVLWKNMVNAKAANAQIMTVPIKIEQPGSAHKRWVSTSGTILWDFARKEVFSRELGNTAGLAPISVGEYPLFFKITNAAGDLT